MSKESVSRAWKNSIFRKRHYTPENALEKSKARIYSLTSPLASKYPLIIQKLHKK